MEIGGGGEELDSRNAQGFLRTNDHKPVMESLPRFDSNKTLLDIIREESGGQKDGKKSWKNFKEKLRRRNSGGRGSTWTSTVPVPASDIPIHNNRSMSRHLSTRINPSLDFGPTAQPDISAVPDARTPSLLRNSSRAMERASGRFDYHAGPLPRRRLQREDNNTDDEEEEEEEEEENSGDSGEEGEEKVAEEGEGEQQPVRMSLMSLLAETDKQMGFDGLAYDMAEEDEDEEDEEDGGGVEYNNCCVCMVRHKGTAFVPCGHSFCRLCSREMWVQSGNCPLCNNYILEILDIF